MGLVCASERASVIQFNIITHSKHSTRPTDRPASIYRRMLGSQSTHSSDDRHLQSRLDWRVYRSASKHQFSEINVTTRRRRQKIALIPQRLRASVTTRLRGEKWSSVTGFIGESGLIIIESCSRALTRSPPRLIRRAT